MNMKCTYNFYLNLEMNETNGKIIVVSNIQYWVITLTKISFTVQISKADYLPLEIKFLYKAGMQNIHALPFQPDYLKRHQTRITTTCRYILDPNNENAVMNKNSRLLSGGQDKTSK